MTQPVCHATPNARHLDHDELAEWLKDLATLEPQNWRDILFRKAVKIQQALLETAMPAHLQDAPRTLRNAFDVTDPNDPKKTVKVVFASFAVCMEREANQLRSSVPSATEQITQAAGESADAIAPRSQRGNGMATEVATASGMESSREGGRPSPHSFSDKKDRRLPGARLTDVISWAETECEAFSKFPHAAKDEKASYLHMLCMAILDLRDDVLEALRKEPVSEARRSIPTEPPLEATQAVLEWNRGFFGANKLQSPLEIGMELSLAGRIWEIMAEAYNKRALPSSIATCPCGDILAIQEKKCDRADCPVVAKSPSAIERRPDYHDGLIEECAQVCEQQIKVEEAHGRLQARSILTRCAAAIRAVRFSAATDVGHTP